jgi:hypothetical protein
MFVTIDELSEYTGQHQDDNASMPQIYLDASINITEDYLGFALATVYDKEPATGTPSIPLPGIIKLTILRIAALIQSEESGNIGITSKSMQDGSRTFIKTTDYTPYLLQIAKYRQV